MDISFGQCEHFGQVGFLKSLYGGKFNDSKKIMFNRHNLRKGVIPSLYILGEWDKCLYLPFLIYKYGYLGINKLLIFL
jgi:hypothetical protein